jgi:type II secretion system protein N
MNTSKRTRLLKLIGYPAFFGAAFSLMLFLTFPYDALGQLVGEQARRSGMELTFDRLGPGFFGVRARGVSVKLPKQDGQTAEPEPIYVESVSVRPSLLPPGVKVSADLFGGSLDATWGAVGNPTLTLKAKGLDLLKTNAKAAVGLDLTGKLGAVVELKLDKKDPTKTTGRVALMGESLLVNGGTVANYDLPKIDLGRLDAELKLENGKASVQTFRGNGADLELTVDGEVGLGQKPMMSTLKLKAKFKPSDDLLKRNSFIATGLGFAMAKDSGGFYAADIQGMLGNPRFKPIK